jgi:sporulation protein YlmC with PRC-barrel domain
MSTSPTLLRLNDTRLTVADPAQDVRGRKVLDKNGEQIGHVEDLLVDDTEKHVRFLLVGSGGFLGFGEKKFLIPVDAVMSVKNDAVQIDRTRDHVANGPIYDPAIAEDRSPEDHYSAVYGYYGFMPFWGIGYTYPSFPFYL